MHEPQPTPTAQQPLRATPQPTVAPPGRLVRLGVTLDLDGPVTRLREVARMCDRAGIGALWVDERRAGPAPSAELDAWTALTLVAPVVERVRLGAMFLTGLRPAAVLARMAVTLDAALGGRLEVGLRAAGDGDDPAAALAALGDELARIPAVRGGGNGAAGRPVLSVELPAGTGAAGLAAVAGTADDVLLPAGSIEATIALAGEVRAACQAAGRDPATLGIAARLPVSIGRTKAEAQARWDATPSLAGLGPPDVVAVFGTLEQCHERVIRLAHAGVTELRCLLPDAIDVHDVIAQLTAMSVGTVAKLAPGTPRSPDPAPPPGWGGSRRFPGGPAGPAGA